MSQARTIILHDSGINWTWFHLVRINQDKARVVRSWRAHKYERRGFWPKSSACMFYGRIYTNSINIKLWMEDGKPGGIDGARAWYRRPGFIQIQDLGSFNLTKEII